MEIILSRHGNTFGPKDPVVWTGSSNDLPLVEQGIAQAEKFANTLVAQKFVPKAIFCGPLQRTFKYASIITQRVGLSVSPIVDSRLNEVDYGDWTGLTNEQVASRFGISQLKGWDEQCIWPTQGNWGGSELELLADVSSFVEDLKRKYDENDRIVVITSNGRLRYFLKRVEGEFEKRLASRSFKVKTGNICKLENKKGVLSISYWNVEPVETFPL